MPPLDLTLLALAAGAAGAVIGWVFHRRERRRIAQHADARTRKMSELIEHAPCVLWEADVVFHGADWQWTMRLHPSEFGRQLFRGRIPPPNEDLWADFIIDRRGDMDVRARQAILGGQPGYEQEFRAVRGGETYWLHEDVSITRTAAERYLLVGLVTDRSAQRRAEAARRESEQTVERILAQAQCMIWRATVLEEQGVLKWPHFDIPHSQLSERIFGPGPREYSYERGFWDGLEMPQQAEMDVRSTRAIRTGAPGYEQQFRVVARDGRTFWLDERVSITPVGERSWSLVGVVTDITTQAEADELTRRNQDRLAGLLDASECMIWEAAVRRRADNSLEWDQYIPPSALYRRIFGEPAGRPQLRWADLDIPEYREMVARTLAALNDGASGYTQEFHIVRPAGELWLREAVAIQRLGDDRYRMTGVITDTTSQRESDAARRASENRLGEVLSRADCLLWESTVQLHPDGWRWEHSIQPSLLYLRLSGSSFPTAEDEMWPAERVPERREMDRRCREALLAGGSGYDQTFHYVRENGEVVWISENVKIHRLGPDLFSLVGVAVDITAARRAEMALAEERERLVVTLRAMHEAVITTDTAGRVQFLNPAAIALLELPGGGGIGRPVDEICRLESARTGQAVSLSVARATVGNRTGDLPPQTRLVTPGGRHRVVEGRCAPIHASDSKVVGTVLVLRDVTEQDRLEQELVRATRLESVGVLAGGIAHDFNNILTAVMGNLALAQLDVPAESTTGTSLRAAEKAALRARDLTQQLLTFAKGGEPLRAAVQLETVLREVASFALSGSQVKAHFDLAPNLWPADADKGQIGRVVQNLVLNAVQAMPRGGTLRITARNDEVGDGALPGLEAGRYVQIAISDTGTGIRPENLSRIFDPYFTTKDTGSGLGLAAVYSIVRKHHGHIEVESQIGRGSTFRFWLPALHEGSVAAGSRTPWGSEVRLRGRVLFMDDEEIIRTMAGTLLRRLGLEVECAADGAEAVEHHSRALTEGRRFDLVIMDLTVPGGMGGLEALARLRAIDPDVRAVVSSGYSSDPVLANFRQHGFVAVVAKPYEVGEITRVLCELLPPA